MNSTMKRKTLVSIFLLAGLIQMSSSCEKEKDDEGDKEPDHITLSLNLEIQNQKMRAFGASDAWSTQFVGRDWPSDKKEKIAELLFSREFDGSGNPKGIGLSGWRFNIGGGSTELGGASQIWDEWRRAECFLNSDGSYNWSKQAGQRWMANRALQHGLEELTAFVNSPPVHYTKNGLAWSDGGSSANLKDEHYQDYAVFLATVMKELKERDGLEFNHLSPVNEPQWDWAQSGQEGSPFRNDEIARVVRLLSKELETRSPVTEIEITDAGEIKYLYKYSNKPARGNQVVEFFSPESGNYIADLPNVSYKIAGHSYWSTYPVSYMLEERNSLRNTLSSIDPDLEFWQSEYCILENNDLIQGSGRDLGMESAMYLARLIHYDLTVANSSTWYWWLGISPYDFKDGLVYIDKNKTDGGIYESKLMWALGNYSRFIRPGMHRYKVIRSDNKLNEVTYDGLMASGYASEDLSKGIFVLVNWTLHSYPVKVKTIDNRETKKVSTYTTSSLVSDNLSFLEVSPGSIITVPKRSIVTVIMDF
jgi:hypothetical protein